MPDITGSIEANQIAVGSGTDTIAGSSQLTFDGAELLMQDAEENRWLDANFGTGTDAHSWGLGDIDNSFNGTKILGNDTAGTIILEAQNGITTDGYLSVGGYMSISSFLQIGVINCLGLGSITGSLTPSAGMVIGVNDYNGTPAWGAVVTSSSGGGTANALVWYNGTNWTIIGM